MNPLHSSTAGRARRFLQLEVRRLRDLERRARAALRLHARTAKGEVLVLPGAGYRPGLFSQFATVLGLLEHFDRRPGRYAGLRVDFEEGGLYYEPAAGPNWWDYYFEPIRLGSGAGPVHRIGDEEMYYFARRVETSMARPAAAALVARYVRPRPALRERVDAFVRERFAGAAIVGVHYRGTDKAQDAPRVPYERLRDAVRRELDALDAVPPVRRAIFLATDEQGCVDFLRDAFPGRVHCLDLRRSTDGSPIDVVQGDNRRKGEDAVADCLLLARCDRLVRTASNLGLCATFFNPRLPVALLSRER